MTSTANLGTAINKLSTPWLGAPVYPVRFELSANDELTIPIDPSARTVPTDNRQVYVIGLLVSTTGGGDFTLQSDTGTAQRLSFSLAPQGGIHYPFQLNGTGVTFNTEPGEALVLKADTAMQGRLYIVEA